MAQRIYPDKETCHERHIPDRRTTRDVRYPRNLADMGQEILDATGVQGGLIVHLGCGDGELTAALNASDRYWVHGLATDSADVEKARATVREQGKYGLVSIGRFDGSRLPYVDDLVNLVVSDDLGDVPMDEVMRVLAPGGVAYVKAGGAWKKTVKPWPDDIDEWTHYLHGPDNNAVAHDTRVAMPRSIQWVAGPRWGRSHEELASMSTAVTAGGRIFYIVDEAPLASIRFHGQLEARRPRRLQRHAAVEEADRPVERSPAAFPQRPDAPAAAAGCGRRQGLRHARACRAGDGARCRDRGRTSHPTKGPSEPKRSWWTTASSIWWWARRKRTARRRTGAAQRAAADRLPPHHGRRRRHGKDALEEHVRR